MGPGTRLYTPSPQLHQVIAAVEAKVRSRVQVPIALIEYISLPDFGQHIILRFAANSPPEDIEAFDVLETQLREIVGEDFWANLVNQIYPPQFLAQLPQRLEGLTPRVADIPMPVSSFKLADRIQNDAGIIRAALIDPALKVWEIEIPWQGQDLPILRVIGGRNESPAAMTIDGQEFLVEVLPLNDSYVNLVKAYTLASQAAISLSHYIFER